MTDWSFPPLVSISIVDTISLFYFSENFNLGGCPEVMVTYILIIYRNYIIPNLGEYILKISSKLIDDCKS